MTITIVKWYDATTVLWTGAAENMRAAVIAAVEADADLTNADLTNADLRDANLRGADLRGADLTNADLTDADLTDADLTNADLTNADLTDADLRGADLTNADLTDANLRDANLRGADLRGADLTNADLTDADLTDADLRGFKADLYAVLSEAPAEVPGLLAAIRAGQIDGSAYQGACACLVGTIANVRGCDYNQLGALVPDSSRPAETWFMGIAPGDTPATNFRAQMAEQWIAEWLDRMRAAFGATA